MSSPSWQPDQYLRYRSERARPFHDLVAQLPLDGVATAADLGCGPGHLTQTLLDRWPGVRVTGVDSSPEMLERANAFPLPERLTFVEGDIATWEPPRPLDCVISNAALQWVPDHEALIPRLAGIVALSGTLAFQVPNNNEAPAYCIFDAMRTTEPWATLAPAAAGERTHIRTPDFYIETLSALAFSVDCWETIYYHQLGSPADIVEWVKGSALRPVLDALDADDGARFLAEYEAEVERAYPAGPSGVLFPFRRLFVVARRR